MLPLRNLEKRQIDKTQSLDVVYQLHKRWIPKRAKRFERSILLMWVKNMSLFLSCIKSNLSKVITKMNHGKRSKQSGEQHINNLQRGTLTDIHLICRSQAKNCRSKIVFLYIHFSSLLYIINEEKSTMQPFLTCYN